MSEEQKTQKFLKAYLTESNIKEDFAERILKMAYQYQTKDKQKYFIGRFFDILKKCYDGKNPKNFVVAGKRFLFILNKLLGGDGKKGHSEKYCQIISQQIVQIYLFIFEIIFKNSLHEFTIDLKMYRMKWAKRINDMAFIKLRQQIQKRFNKFNLDKGFSEENLQKIKKFHKKRGLTQKQSNFYLGLEPKEQIKQTTVQKKSNKSSSSDSQQSSNQEQQPHKKVKIDNTSNPIYKAVPNYAQSTFNANYGYQPRTVYTNSPSQIPYDPRYNRSPYNQSTHSVATNSSSPGNNFQYKSSKQEPSKTNGSYNFSTSNTSSSMYFPPPSYSLSNTEGHPGKVPYEFHEVNETQSFLDSNLEKARKLRDRLQKNLFKCRQCGQMFQTHETYEKHTTQHFMQALQKVNQVQFKGKLRKQSKLKLFDQKSWEAVQESGEKDYIFQVLLSEISDIKTDKYFCFFCNQVMEVSFSSKYQDWVLSNAIKINDQGSTNIMHFDCYESFKSDQNSLASN